MKSGPTPSVPPDSEAKIENRGERRYVALVSLARRLGSARKWDELAGLISQCLGEYAPARVRLWGMTRDGIKEGSSLIAEQELVPSVLELTRAATSVDPIELGGEATLIGLGADGVSYGVIEVHGGVDREILRVAAPMVANRLAVLVGHGAGDLRLSPAAVGDAGDTSTVVSAFANQAKRLLDHDRLSVYLLTYDGRAFERFAVATSPIVPGEGILIPFEDVGLRHIVLTNEALLSSDLGADPRLSGSEDRVVAEAGFRGLLSVPLRHDGRPFGVLNFVSRKAGFYRRDDVPIAQQIADQAASFIQNLRQQRRAHSFLRLEASEHERTRIVRDLYQAVAEMLAEIDSVAATIAADDAARIQAISEAGLDEMRRAIVDLDPPGLEHGGLRRMVEQSLHRHRHQTCAETTLEIRGELAELPPRAAEAAYRVLQEALTNVKRHAEAGEVAVALSAEPDLVLEIVDDGIGFEPREVAAGGGFGIRHMRERAESAGGFLKIQSKAGAGTRIRLAIPTSSAAFAGGGGQPPGSTAADAEEGSLRVFVADSNLVLRAGLCRLVELDERLRVVGETGSAEELLGHTRQLHPDVIMLSAAIADGSARELVGDILAGSPSSAIVVISHGDVGRDAELLDAGAAGSIRLPIDQEVLTRAVHAVAGGTRVIAGGGDRGGTEGLTPREREVLALVAEGRTNAQIGERLFLATKTVERQVTTIVRKLGARNRAHAAAIAAARRIIRLPGEFG